MLRKLSFYSAIIGLLFTANIAIASDNAQISDKLTNKKLLNINSKLKGNLIDLRDEWKLTNSQGIAFTNTQPLVDIVDNHIVVDAVSSTDENAQALATKLQDMGMRKVAVYGKMVSGQFPLSKLDSLSAVDELAFMRSSYAITNVGNTTSQGDVSMNTDDVRSLYSIDGSSVTVGVLSDSYDCQSGAAGDVASGDLPSGIVVLEEETGCGSGSDEGRAMMQLIHDVAPGSNQIFHSAFNGMANFAQGITDLRVAGADVIVDDIFYFAEPFFQDGIVAQSADASVAAGVPYYTSAGNSARDSYQSAYVNTSATTVAGITANWHDFDPGAGVDNIQQINVPIGATVSLSLQWSQPFFSVSGSPGAATDIDFALTDAAGTTILTSSTDNNIGGDPVEIIVYQNNSGSSTLGLVITKFSGPDPALIKYIGFRNLTINEYDTASSTAAGHANAANAVSVGAAYYQQTPAFGTNPPVAESFSSAGGTPILFDTSGNTVNISRQNPDIVAPDGTNTTFFGGDSDGDGYPNFFGTSAAAPHAAAAAALMLEYDNTLTPATINTLMESTAINMDVAGYDFNTGHGLIDIEAAFASISATLPAATLVSPLGPVTDTTPTFTWNAVADSTWYRIWVRDSLGQNNISWHTKSAAGCSSGTGTCSLTPSNILPTGSSEWWIQTYNDTNGNGPWSAVGNFTVEAPLAPPILITPSGAISDTTPTYTWNAVPGATYYQLYIADSTGATIVQWHTIAAAGCPSGTGTCSRTPLTPLAEGNAGWWVRAYNPEEGNGPWSAKMDFSVSDGLPAATLIDPSGVITDPTPPYTWNAVPGSTWYRLWITDSTGVPVIKWYSRSEAGCPSGTGTCLINPLTPLALGSGNWWVQTYNSTTGNGPWSAPNSFTLQ